MSDVHHCTTTCCRSVLTAATARKESEMMFWFFSCAATYRRTGLTATCSQRKQRHLSLASCFVLRLLSTTAASPYSASPIICIAIIGLERTDQGLAESSEPSSVGKGAYSVLYVPHHHQTDRRAQRNNQVELCMYLHTRVNTMTLLVLLLLQLLRRIDQRTKHSRNT